MLKTGIIGTIIVVLCCFTPVLVILFGDARADCPTLNDLAGEHLS